MFTSIEGGVCAAKGFTAGGVHCGIRKNKEKADLALIVSEVPCSAAAMYTLNKVQGAPLTVNKLHLIDGKAQAIICNSGNANTCNPNGVELAMKICHLTAEALDLPTDSVVIGSTGVIGLELPLKPFIKGIPAVKAALSKDGSEQAALAIMTTDTALKNVARQFQLDDTVCHIGGIAKGSGMIHPNMATMLCYLTTDAAISPAMLHKALQAVVPATFNQVSVDGDTSTNDNVVLLANGLASNAEIIEDGADYATFVQVLTELLTDLSRRIAKDGEGATKLLECTVTGAPDLLTARAVSKSVITSSLFKAAMFGADANWGRALCAIGYTPGDFDISKTSVRLQSKKGSVLVCKNAGHSPYSEKEASKILQEDEIAVLVNLHSGNAAATAWGCDLTYDYVKINGDYRT